MVDESYLKKCKELANFKNSYNTYVLGKTQELKAISSKNIDILNFEELITQIQLIEAKYKSNLALIDWKFR